MTSDGKEKHATIIDQLRDAVANGISCNQLAHQIGYNQPSLSRFVKGEGGISLEVAAKIAAFYEMELSEPIEIEEV